MKATTKRLLVLLTAMVLLVSVMGMTALATEAADEPVCYVHGDVNGDGDIDSRDAIRTLFYALWNDSVSVNQNCDFNGDDSVTQKDAIYLLFVSLGMDGYESKGTVHNYLEPVWHWETAGVQPAVTVSLKCACGTPHPITEEISIVPGEEKAPTCVADGFKKYTAKVTYDGVEYENAVTVTVPATGDGHSFASTPTCEAGVKCQNCDFTKPALGHSYALNGEKTEGCKHIKQYKCDTCGKEIAGTAESDVYYTHSYTAKLTKEATCTAEGEQTLTCACGDVQTEKLPVNETFHVWNNGVEANGVTTYTCACGETKTVVQMSDTGVSAEALKENEVQLDDAGTSVALDEATAQQLDADKEVVIKVEEVNKSTVGLDAEKLEQIGDAKIYDFSMLSGDQPVTDFDGKVTVSLPYELQDGDDVNDIDVWYIDDQGNVQSFEGKYNNGFVTFQTSHFSYYTVTRMTPAERCARYGHNMVEQNKTATCTEDGYAKKFCLRCGFVEKDEKSSRLGHDHQIDDMRSVDATCKAPGQKVEVCSRCQNEKTEELRQLTHGWEKTQSVAASCTAKGYDKFQCKLCKEEKIENEQPAIGHSYVVNAQGWQWAEDHSKASVTLVCENEGCTLQKALDAVITKKLDGSVCLGGDATYTATVSHNNKTYTDTATGKETGAGQHTPDGKWVVTDTQHHQLCAVCGEKVGLADHNWERKVTQQPTCDKSGKATETCSVCDKEREVILPATGEHNFVNGTCSVCGYTEGSCQHKKLTATEIDLGEFGACGGMVTIQSCDCGKIRRVSKTEFACDFEEKDNSDDENNIYCYTYTCKTCGLVAEQSDYRVIDEATCSGNWTVKWKITKGDTVIAETEDKDGYVFYHPVTVKHATIDFADYGLCARKATQRTCPCGASSRWDMDEGGCQWQYDEATETYSCSVCGATAKETRTTKEENCTYSEIAKTILFKDGRQVLEIVDSYVEVYHDHKVESIEMYGDTCQDGYYMVRVCADCGEKEASYYDWCTYVVDLKKIVTTGAGSCSNAILIRTCPCGAETQWYYDDYEAGYHEWSYEYDPQIQEYREICTKCGFYTERQSETIDPSKKDENCRVDFITSITYTNGKGSSFQFELPSCQYFHDIDRTFVLKGDSCEDGVTITETCKDCDYADTWTNSYHQSYELEKLDLSAYGYCGEYVVLNGCPCGLDMHISGDYACEWESKAGDEGYTEYVCRICGMTKSQKWKELESDLPCVTRMEHTYTYYKDGEELGSLTYVENNQHHRYVFTLELMEGATTCNDGWEANGTCLDCGDTYFTQGGGCSQYPVERKTISTDAMCGVLDQVRERCACGRFDDVNTQWVSNEHCEFSSHGEYSDEYSGWRYYCAVCGCSRVTNSTLQPVEGDICHKTRVIKQIILDANDAQIAVVERTELTEDHDWLYTYDLKGEICADGWSYTITCADCGETEVYDHINTYCESNNVARELVYDNEDTCGPVYVYRVACACGANDGYDVEYACQNGSWNNQYYTCADCGMVNTNSYSYEHIPGTCRETVEMKYVFYLNDAEVARVEKTFEQADHISVYSYQMFGGTCEEGFQVYRNCAYCDFSEFYDETSGHSTYRTGYYEFPAESCGGDISVYSCPCDQEYRVEYSNNCSMTSKNWTETDEDGVSHEFYQGTCSKCGMISNQEWYYTEGQDPCHRVLHQDYTWMLGDWEINLTGISTSEQHQYKNITLIPSNPNNCEDGVEVFKRCAVCGNEKTTTHHYGHPTKVVETIDLAQYGAVCGAKLEKVECACGFEKGYELSSETLCDLDEKDIPHFVEGTIDQNEYTTDGWGNTWSYSYSYICSVTEPACGLNIRYSRYWLVKDCVATQYETWQLGYDAETDTCQKELTFATGKTDVYHNYEYSSVNEVVDGNSVSGSKYTCTDCGSYYTELSYYEGGRQAKYERYGKNLLENGQTLERTEIWERVYFEDHQYTSLQRDAWKNADGSTEWEQWAYTYDFEGGCQRTEVYTSSDGGYNTNTQEWHNVEWKTEWIVEPTCTQFGNYIEREICCFCNKQVREYSYQAEPNAHNWHWDEAQNVWLCGNCGLESANGASGSIVMEDLTEETGAEYVIGYWNRDQVQFNPYVGLVLYDAVEGENDELVLDGISVKMLTVENDGICGLSFNKADTAAAAAAALKAVGYTGTYAVRISCVPLGSTNVLDYAITFETLTAE